MSFWKGKQPLIGQKGVKYGLQDRDTSKVPAPRSSKLGLFGDDEDDDEGGNRNQLDRNAAVRAAQGVKRNDAKINKMHADALALDANIYDYDAYVDSIQSNRKEAERAKFEEETKGPQYLYALMEAKKNRDREQNIMYERRLARERKTEDALHGDKEQFVTGAYKRKLEEDKLWAQQQDAKDTADLARNADAVGMDGFMSVLTTAINKDTTVPSESEHKGDSVENNGDGDVVGKLTRDTLEADLDRRAELQLKKRLQHMDKHELKRFELERKLGGAKAGTTQDSATDQQVEDAAVAPGPSPARSDDDATPSLVKATSLALGEKDRVQTETTAKKRAGADAIAAARARAAERKRARLATS